MTNSTNSSQAMSLLDRLNERQREAVLATEGPGAGAGRRRHRQDARDHLSHRASARTARAGKRDPGGDVHQQGRQSDAGAHQRSAARERHRRLRRVGLHVPFFLRAAAAPRSARILGCRAISPFTTTTTRPPPSSGRCCSSICPPTIFLRAAIRSQISHAKNHGITPEEMRADADQARDDTRQQASEVFSRLQSDPPQSGGPGFRRPAAALGGASARTCGRARGLEFALSIS